MTTETTNPIPAARPDSESVATQTPAPAAPPTPSPTAHSEDALNRHTGKVARLPKATRDQLNSWLLDGVPYQEIIVRLGDLGRDLNPGHIHEWKKRGYQDWLREQDRLAETRARQETAADLMRDFDATQVSHAALQLGTLHVYEALRDLSSGGLDDKLGGSSAAFARLLNALARASRETMQLQKYHEACTRARLELSALQDPTRQLSEHERRAVVRKVDDILGLHSHSSEPLTPNLQS